MHGGGAARTAHKHFGAIMYQAIGLQGKSYAIPTMDNSVSKQLPIADIQLYVDMFITFAAQNTHLNFMVTDIGCGIAGFEAEEIAPLFKNAIPLENVYFSEKFYGILGQN